MDYSKSLQELERDDWGDPKEPTEMVKRCLRLRRVPLKDLSADDCRLLLGQRIGARFIVPVALKFLADDPMESGIGGAGALLGAVLHQPQEFWQSHHDLCWQVKEVLLEVRFTREGIEDLSPAISTFHAMNGA